MKRILLIVLSLILSSACARLPSSGAPEAPFPLPSTTGGTDGAIIRVTNLEAGGPGSLRAALETPGPRLIVFEVGGVIDLALTTLTITEPYVTVAGQTAPYPGITLIRGGIVIAAHDVLIQHLRIRPGDAGQPRRSGWEPDGITTSSPDAYNVVIDHCSITWSVDENLSASGPQFEGRDGTSHTITFSHNIIAEALDRASHSEGAHSKGTLIHDHVTQVALIGNLYAHNADRNPYVKADATAVVLNNVIYNPGSALTLDFVPGEYKGQADTPRPARVTALGNVLLFGPDTPFYLRFAAGRGEIYMADNLCFRRNGKPARLADRSLTLLDVPPIQLEGVTPLPASAVLEDVLAHAGARPWERDAIDARIVQSVRDGTGRIIDSQDDVGGYPLHPLAAREARLEVPAADRQIWLQSFEE